MAAFLHGAYAVENSHPGPAAKLVEAAPLPSYLRLPPRLPFTYQMIIQR